MSRIEWKWKHSILIYVVHNEGFIKGKFTALRAYVKIDRHLINNSWCPWKP